MPLPAGPLGSAQYLASQTTDPGAPSAMEGGQMVRWVRTSAALVTHGTTHATETAYWQVIVPAIRGGATVMDSVFGDTDSGDSQSPKTATA